MFTLRTPFHFKKFTAVSLAMVLTFSGLPGFLNAAPRPGTLPAKAPSAAPYKQGTAVHRSGPPLCLKNGHATPCAPKNAAKDGAKEDPPSQVEAEEDSIGQEQAIESAADDAEAGSVIEIGENAFHVKTPYIQEGAPDTAPGGNVAPKKTGGGKGAAVAGALLGVGLAAGVVYYVAVGMKPKRWCGSWNCNGSAGCISVRGANSGTWVRDTESACRAYVNNDYAANSCHECDQ